MPTSSRFTIDLVRCEQGRRFESRPLERPGLADASNLASSSPQPNPPHSIRRGGARRPGASDTIGVVGDCPAPACVSRGAGRHGEQQMTAASTGSVTIFTAVEGRKPARGPRLVSPERSAASRARANRAQRSAVGRTPEGVRQPPAKHRLTRRVSHARPCVSFESGCQPQSTIPADRGPRSLTSARPIRRQGVRLQRDAPSLHRHCWRRARPFESELLRHRNDACGADGRVPRRGPVPQDLLPLGRPVLSRDTIRRESTRTCRGRAHPASARSRARARPIKRVGRRVRRSRGRGGFCGEVGLTVMCHHERATAVMCCPMSRVCVL